MVRKRSNVFINVDSSQECGSFESEDVSDSDHEIHNDGIPENDVSLYDLVVFSNISLL